MDTIRTYTNTKCELEMAKARLGLLQNRKERLFSQYFPVTAEYRQISAKTEAHKNDRMADYVHRLHEVDVGTGRSLADEIEYQQGVVDQLFQCVTLMNEALSRMKGIEYALYYEIVVKGVGISRAVSRIAERYHRDDRTIWKRYYSKIKNDLKILEKYSESSVISVL